MRAQQPAADGLHRGQPGAPERRGAAEITRPPSSSPQRRARPTSRSTASQSRRSALSRARLAMSVSDLRNSASSAASASGRNCCFLNWTWALSVTGPIRKLSGSSAAGCAGNFARRGRRGGQLPRSAGGECAGHGDRPALDRPCARSGPRCDSPRTRSGLPGLGASRAERASSPRTMVWSLRQRPGGRALGRQHGGRGRGSWPDCGRCSGSARSRPRRSTGFGGRGRRAAAPFRPDGDCRAGLRILRHGLGGSRRSGLCARWGGTPGVPSRRRRHRAAILARRSPNRRWFARRGGPRAGSLC